MEKSNRIKEINELKYLIKNDIEIITYFDTEIEKLEKTRLAYINKTRELENKIEEILAEEWRSKADKGEFKISCEYKGIPKIIRNEWHKIEREITHGCTGDWNDGCRGCDMNCSWKANEAFMKKYNIGKIIW